MNTGAPDLVLRAFRQTARTIMLRLRTLLANVLITLVLFASSVIAAETTAPGTVIFNRAELSYFDPESNGEPLSSVVIGESIFQGIFSDDSDPNTNVISVSNFSSVSVGFLYQFLVENEYQLTQDAGSVVQFPHRIINQGNALDFYSVSFPDLDTSAFINPAVFLDLNRNGTVDSSEPELGTTPAVLAGDGIDIIVVARLSPELVDGTVQDFQFTVSAENTNDIQTLSNTVTVGRSALLLSLTSGPGCSAVLFPGDIVTSTVSAQNISSNPLVASPYLVDNQIVDGLVIDLPIESNLSYVGFVGSGDLSVPGISVVRLEEHTDFEWINADSLSSDSASRIVSAGYFIDVADFEPGFELGDVASFTVEREVLPDLNGQRTGLTEASVDTNADGIPDVISNSTCSYFTSLSSPELQSLQFIEPATALKDSGTSPDFFAARDFVGTQSFTLKRGDGALYSVVRDGVYLQLELGDPNHPDIQEDINGNRFVVSTVTSSATDDVVNVVMLETDSPGVFRSIAPIALSENDRSDDGFCPAPPEGRALTPVIDEPQQSCVLQSADNDQLTAGFGELGINFQTAVLGFVQGRSVVFDSQTLQPVPGAIVKIIDADTDEVAVDVWTGEPFEFTTGASGEYFLPPLIESRDYYLDVDTRLNHVFPSIVPASELRDFTVFGFSYGKTGFGGGTDLTGVFSGEWINDQNVIDIPLDPLALGFAATDADRFLTIDKVATKSSIDVGESVSYTVSVSNSIDAPIVNVQVFDTLPFGFRYVPGSTLLRGEPAPDPIRADNGNYIFDVGTIEVEETAELRYALSTTAAAIDGDGINRVLARGLTETDNLTESLTASARVEMQTSGIFSNQAALFGKVYVDQNCDGLQNNKEWPIGGVRLYLQDGTYAITDADGLFSLYGVDPGLHVVKLDEHTLPEGLTLKLLNVDQAADAGSYFVDVTAGDFRRVDFAAVCPTENVEQVFQELKLRNRYLDRGWALDQAEDISQSSVQRRRNQLSRATAADGDLSNGVIDGPTGIAVGDTETDEDAQEQIDQIVSNVESDSDGSQIPDAKEVVSTITSEQGKAGTWLWPLQDLSTTGRFMAVIRSGIDPTLYINGEAVSADQIGERLVNRREKAQVVAWYGVELDEGENVVEIKGKDPFGNERVLAKNMFKKPSRGTQIELVASSKTVPADGGRSVLPITLKILDKNGYPALGVYFITLESSDGNWVERDIQDSEPGRQIRVENGERVVHYRSSGVTGEVRVRASTNEYSEDLVIRQVSETRPLLATGFVSGSYSFGEELGGFSVDTDLDDLARVGEFDTRAAVFIKGQVKEKYNLTLSYDSDKDSNEELFRDIDRELHYPILGDSSIRGFEAQSRSKLYLKIERDQNSVLWGDFATNPNGDQQDLSKINRTLTGFSSVFNIGENNIRVFAAEQENRNFVEEIPGNGSALAYRVAQFPILPNSENIELVTRSRENPGLILDTVKLSRFGDYTIDDELGFLSFPAAVPTLDVDQNPVFIRIAYDVEESEDTSLVSGVHFSRLINDRLKIGGGISYDGNDADGILLSGVHADYRVGNNTYIEMSVANSDSDELGSGLAHRVAIEHRWSDKRESVSSLTHASADESFSNQGVGVTAGRTETRLRHTRKLGDKTRLELDASRSASSSIDDERYSVGAVVERRVKNWDLRSGLSHTSQSGLNGEDDSTTAIFGARRKYKLLGKDASGNFELEQDLASIERSRISLGTKISLQEKVSAYGNYEFVNNLIGLGGFSNDSATTSFTLGIESRVLPSTRLYSEYRHRGLFESLQQETVTGVRGDYEIREGIRISPNFEYISNFGPDGEDSIAASVGVRDTRNPNSRKSLRVETRQSDDTDHYGLRASLVSRINQDWTAVVQDDLSRQETRGTDPVQRHTFSAAITRRPKYNNKHHMLFLYRFNQENGVDRNVERNAHVLSTHQNFQVGPATTISGRLGFKKDRSQIDFSQISDFSALIDTRAAYDLSRRLNLYLSAGALSTNNLSEVRYSVGAGTNFTLNRNLRLNFAYNFTGFREEDLDIGEYNVQGLSFGLQYKIDSELFKWLK